LIGAEIGIKISAAAHCQCRSWVIRDRANPHQCRTMSAMPPIATIHGRSPNWRGVPIRTEACVTPPSIALGARFKTALWERLWERYGHKHADW